MCAKVYAFCCFGGFQRGPAFIEELLSIIEYANKKEFTSLIIVYTNRREPDALLIIGLPNGPTANFKLSKLVLRKDIKNHGNPTNHELELVLNNFTTRLGHRIGRYIFETKETKQAEVKGKKTKDSKADAITKAKPFARLQECGPRFTVKLISLQHGTFDPRGGEFEWVHKVIHLSVNSFQYIGFISLS
ncbi:putative anticodon-binding, Brix domain-containing protein [Rosa chinensis]|uniref:Putative anticodon-binding, Brix domain-containing protein n=1 Tax=Rosa chinensis TaxID=74649 RepID=A0A2P6RPM3_ROSCH|nr:putative anticodon-binding, Brix domain-containing protein [Rosa chinensis]